MDEAVVVENVVPFLNPGQAMRVFPRMSRGVGQVFSQRLTGHWWSCPDWIDNVELFACWKDRLSSEQDRHSAVDELFVLLLQSPAQLMDLTAVNGDTVLHVVCRKGEWTLVDLVLRFDVNVNVRGAGDLTPLHCAAFARSESVCRALVAAHANAALRDSIGRLPENWASVQQAHQLATFLRQTRKLQTRRLVGCFSWLKDPV